MKTPAITDRLFREDFIRRTIGPASLLLLFLVTLGYLVATLFAGLVPDEGIYMLVTKTQATGGHLYLRFVDHQPPGLPFAGVPFYWLFGNTVLAAKSAVVFYNVVNTAAVGWIAYVLTGGSRPSAFTAAGLAGFYAALYGLHVGVNVSSYAQVFFAAGAALALSVSRSRHPTALAFCGGLLIGYAFMTKPSTALETLPLLGLIYFQRRRGRDVILALVGAAVLVGVMLLYFTLDGTLYEMLYVFFPMNLSYISFTNELFGYQVQGPPSPRAPWFKDNLLAESLPFIAALLVIAGVMLIWNWRHKRTPALILVAAWAGAALVEAAMPVSMAIRYFYGPFAPLALLGTLSLGEAQRSRMVRGALVLVMPLLVVAAVMIDQVYPLRRQVYPSDYRDSLALLDERLEPGDCLLNWGWLNALIYLSDHPPCSRIALEGNLMPRGIYDVRPLRAWFFEDIFATKPSLVGTQPPWSFYPSLQRLMNFRQQTEVFFDQELRAHFYTLDWSTYHDGDAVINDELELIGYDLVPAGPVRPGEEIAVNLYWKVKKVPAADYQGYVHVTLPGDYANKLATLDAFATDPYVPMPDWWRGDVVVGRTYRLALPPDIPPGAYEVVTGMYRLFPDGSTAPLEHRVRSTGAPLPVISLGQITVRID